jgi:hypothetical protein
MSENFLSTETRVLGLPVVASRFKLEFASVISISTPPMLLIELFRVSSLISGKLPYPKIPLTGEIN